MMRGRAKRLAPFFARHLEPRRTAAYVTVRIEEIASSRHLARRHWSANRAPEAVNATARTDAISLELEADPFSSPFRIRVRVEAGGAIA
jgi:hypothetical protein